ncbi:MAG: NAD-dependent epimerase/dehydratase family protein [Chloroflexota bacterium]|nr:NAD-dependent epimerase/dehydratase family protein [Chloroflexota bacterium]
MQALVIGGNGFIGSHLVDRLIELDWDVVVLDIQERRWDPLPGQVNFIRGDLSRAYLVREALAGADLLFHLAWSTIHEVANRDPGADVENNLIPSIELIQAAQRVGVSRFVFTSSGGTVYGPTRQVPTPETHPRNPITAYGVSKLAVEKYLQMYHHIGDLDYAVLRPSVPYGPRQNPLGNQGAVAVFLYRVARGLPITIWGDGSITRDFFYITDLVDALIRAAEEPLSDERTFNIGGTQEISLNQLVKVVEKTVGKKAVAEYLPARPFDAPRVHLDTSRAQAVLDWQPKVDLEPGIQKTWAWINDNFS